MTEPSPVEMARLEQVRRIVHAMYDGLVKKVIADIKALPDHCRQSGDDSKLKDVWEEFKFQVQGEESIYFEAYQETIEQICGGVVAGLDSDRRRTRFQNLR